MLSCRPSESRLPINTGQLDEISDCEDGSSSSSVHSQDPLLDHQSQRRNSSTHAGDLQHTGLTHTNTLKSGIRLTSHPSLPGPKSESKNFTSSDSVDTVVRPSLHIRQPSAPPVLTNTWALRAERNSDPGRPSVQSAWSAYHASFGNSENGKPDTPTLLASPLSAASTILNSDSAVLMRENKTSAHHQAMRE